MFRLFLILTLGFFANFLFSQSVSINTDGSSADASAMLDIKSTTSGLLIPRMTEAQRDAIASPATGLLIYQTDGTAGFYVYDGSSWTIVAGSSVSGSGTTNYLARWTPDGATLGTSLIRDDGSNTSINSAINSSYILKVYGGGTTTAITGDYNGSIYGYLGSSSYGAYGRNGSYYGYFGSGSYGAFASNGSLTGTLGGDLYGATGSYDGNHVGYLGGDDVGVYGSVSGTAVGDFAGFFLNSATGAGSQYGIYTTADGDAGTGTKYGIYTTATGTATTNAGIYASASGATKNWAGYFVGDLALDNTGSASSLVFYEPGGSNYTSFEAQAQAGNVTYTLPAADGSAGQVLKTDGSGSLAWSNSGALLTAGTGISISTNTINLSHLGIQSLSDPGADRIMFWDDGAGATAWLEAGTNISISGTSLNVADAWYNSLSDITLANGDIFVGNASDNPEARTMSGDITITNTGVTAIGNDKVTEADLKAVNAAADEDILTYETTTGDFEWHTPSELGIITTAERDLVTSGTGLSGGQDNVLVGTDADVTISLTTNKDIVAGTGLTGGENDVLPGADTDVTINIGDGDGLTVNADDIDVNVDNSTIEINSDALRIKDAGIAEVKLNTSNAPADNDILTYNAAGSNFTWNTTSELGIGLWNDNTSYLNPNDNTDYRVYDSGQDYGLYVGEASSAVDAYAVQGNNTFQGCLGELGSGRYTGVGVYGEADGIGESAVYGYNTVSGGYAGYFNGAVMIEGILYDDDGDAGTSGQIFSSTATGTDWIDAPTGAIDGSGSANHIPYWSDANTLTYDNGELYWDATNNRLGVGTAAPSQDLDIAGNSLVTGNMYFAAATKGIIHHGTTGVMGDANGWTPDHADGSGGTWIESGAAEGGGFYVDGNVLAMWAPGDGALLDVYDEDALTSGPRFTIDPVGNVLPGDDDNTRDLGSSSIEWKDLYVDGTAYLDAISVNGAYSLPTADGSSNQVITTDGSGALSWEDLSSLGTVEGTGSASHIAYWSDANTITHDASQLYWDATNNRLGIGLNTPGEAIQVNGASPNIEISNTGETEAGILFTDFGYEGTQYAKVLFSSNDNDLSFYVNNATARVTFASDGDVGIGTTIPGYKLDVAGNINTSSAYKIGGNDVLKIASTGETYLGVSAGGSSTGDYSTFVGYSAGNDNTTGTYNTYLGYQAGYDNATSNYNTVIGSQAGYNNDGVGCTFVGYRSGYNCGASNYNTFVGDKAGQGGTTNYTGTYNAGIGNAAGSSITSGDNNAFIGSNAGTNLSSGSNNSFLGNYAGQFFDIESGVVCIGNEAGPTDNSAQERSNVLFIDNTRTNDPLIFGDFSANEIIINGNGVDNSNGRTFFVNGTAGGTGAWNNDSDVRLKHNIKTISSALNKVLELRGVNFEWKDTSNHDTGIQMGFIAQEAEKIVPEVVDKPNNTDKAYYSMAYAPITALLVEAMKEQQKLIEKLQQENAEIKKKLNNTENTTDTKMQIEKLKKDLKALELKLNTLKTK